MTITPLLYFISILLTFLLTAFLAWYALRRPGTRYSSAQQLHASEARYRRLFEAARDGILILDAKTGVVVDVNPFLVEMLGFPSEEILGKELWELGFFNDIAANKANFLELQQKEYVRYEDLPLQTAHGTRLNVEFVSNVYQVDQTRVVQCNVRDITARKQAEDRLAFQANILGNIKDVVYTTDLQMNLTSWNNAAEKMYGWQEKEVLGRNVVDVVESRFDPDTRSTLTQELFATGSVTVEVEHHSRTGNILNFEAITILLHAADGRVTGLASVNRDISERKQAEARLAQLAAIVDYSEDAIIGKTLAGIITSWNIGAEHLYGYSASEAIGKPVSMLIPIERSDELPEILARVSQGENIRHYETLRLRKDGTCLDVSITVSPIKDASGQISGASTITRDITDRKQAEEALRVSRAELDAALASMTDAVFISDAQGKFINFNDAFATFHKFKSKAECAKTITEYPAFLDVFMENGQLAPLDMWAVPRALRGEKGTNVEYGLRRKDSGETWAGSYSFAPIRDKEGLIVGSVVVGRDITESKRAAQALLASESRYRDLVQNANSAILRWSKDGSILFFNEFAQRLFGYTAEEVFGRNVNILLPATESTGGDLTGLVTDILEHPDHFINQVNENVCRDGRRVWMTWTNKPILDENGEVDEILAVGIDITDRKHAEQALQESESRYRHALDDMLEGCQIIGFDWCYLYLNDIADSHNRRPKQELLGQRYMDMWPGVESTQVFAAIRQCMEERTPQSMENEFVFPDGSSGWFDLKIYPVPEGIVILSIDITDRKKAVQALQAASQRFQVILSSLTGGILVVGLDNRVEFANQSFCDHFALDDAPEQLLGLQASEVIQKISAIYADTPQALARIQEIVAIGQPVQGEEIAITGGRTYIRDFIPIIIDGKLYGRIWHHLDITERKRSENMLHARLRLLDFSAGHPLAELLQQTLDEVCAITDSPVGFYDFVEPDQKTLSHQTWSTRTLQEYCQAKGSDEHFTIEDAGVWVDCIRQRKAVIHNDYASLPHRKGLPAGHAPLIRELVVPIFRNDLIVAILGIGNRDQEYTEKDIEVVSFFADVAWEIAIRKLAEETLRDSESRFHSLFENMLNGFAYCRIIIEEGQPPDLIYLDVNRAFESQTGLKNVVGKKISEVIPGIQASDPELLERYARVSQTGLPESFETHVEAMQMWFSISIYSPQKGYFVAVFDVITDRKLAEQELQAYSEYLEDMVNDRTRALMDAQEKMVRTERLATLGQLAGSVGHELRNPLGVISNAVYFLKMTQPDANPTILDYLDIIEKETRASDKIVTDLLDFTRIKSVDREPIAVSDLFAQTLQRYGVPAGVEVSTELPPDLPQVYADARQIVQVLGNLVTNACQAMAELQTRLTTEDAPQAGKLTLTASLQGDMIAIAVQDTGMGIPPENMGKLFEPLFTTKTKGIGLGLAVSQKLTEANGGSIEAQSQPGQGSTFTIYLPAYTQVVE